MRAELSREFAAKSYCLVEAAAGCGKTELIADAVTHNSEGCQLVLTHTHSGVRALRERLKKRGVSHNRCRVETIAGFALRYASSFPVLSGCTVTEPADNSEYQQIYGAATRVLQRRHVRDIVTASYRGLYVDEYQDCTASQHRIILQLAELVPTRVVGDPLQSIFGFAKDDPLPDWEADVCAVFNRYDTLTTPHRWKDSNPELGSWLEKARRCLLKGEQITIDPAGPVKLIPVQDDRNPWRQQINACKYHKAAQTESVLVIRKESRQAHNLAKRLEGRFRSMEEMECRDLMRLCGELEGASGNARAGVVLRFALDCMTSPPDMLHELCNNLAKNQHPTASQFKRYAPIKEVLLAVANSQRASLIGDALQVIKELPGTTLYRRELYNEALRTMRNHDDSSGEALRRTAWRTRAKTRQVGRSNDSRLVSRTLLVKGLEFDHVIIADISDFAGDAKQLYVALTRGKRSLTVLSSSPTIWTPGSTVSR